MHAMTPSSNLTGRRAELAAAALTVVADGGLRALTHRAVDGAAGVPVGTTSAYLRTRAALLAALAEHVASTLVAGVEELTAHLGPDADAEEVVDRTSALLREWVGQPDLVLVRAELLLEAIRSAELRTVFLSWRERLVSLVTGVAEAKCVPDAAGRSEAVVSALEGILTGALLQPAPHRADHVEDMVATILGGLIATEDAPGQ
jgi:DNA-binding transcriptional regulator YbjK